MYAPNYRLIVKFMVGMRMLVHVHCTMHMLRRRCIVVMDLRMISFHREYDPEICDWSGGTLQRGNALMPKASLEQEYDMQVQGEMRHD